MPSRTGLCAGSPQPTFAAMGRQRRRPTLCHIRPAETPAPLSSEAGHQRRRPHSFVQPAPLSSRAGWQMPARVSARPRSDRSAEIGVLGLCHEPIETTVCNPAPLSQAPSASAGASHRPLALPARRSSAWSHAVVQTLLPRHNDRRFRLDRQDEQDIAVPA
jgi:hypothetical protein